MSTATASKSIPFYAQVAKPVVNRAQQSFVEWQAQVDLELLGKYQGMILEDTQWWSRPTSWLLSLSLPRAFRTRTGRANSCQSWKYRWLINYQSSWMAVRNSISKECISCLCKWLSHLKAWNATYPYNDSVYYHTPRLSQRLYEPYLTFKTNSISVSFTLSETGIHWYRKSHTADLSNYPLLPTGQSSQ
jgi:hypothetical protein